MRLNNDRLINQRKLNAKLNHEEFLTHKIVLKSYPRMLFLELTRVCNLACPMCRPKIITGKELFMSDKILNIVRKELFPYVSVVDLRGWGESTLDPRLFQLIDELNLGGVRCRIFTNLITHNPAYWEIIGSKKIDVAISLESATPELYEKFRRGAKFDHFLLNLENLMKSRQCHNIRNDIYFSVVISDENIIEIPLLIKLATKYNIPVVRLNPITVGQGVESYPTKIGISENKKSEFNEAIKEAIKICRKTKVRIQLGANIISANDGGFDICLHPWSYIFIRYDGGIGFCDHLVNHPRSIMGKIKNQSFFEIWNNQRYQELRKWHVIHYFKELKKHGIECDWCYRNRFADCENLFEETYQPLDVCEIYRKRSDVYE